MLGYVKRNIKKIKKIAVKKVELTKCHEEKGDLLLEFDLFNFVKIRKTPIVQFWIDDNIHDIKKCRVLGNKKLIVTIPSALLDSFDSYAKMKIQINDKSSWITRSQLKENYNGVLLVNNELITTRVSKNVIFTKVFKDFSFKEECLEATLTSRGYSELEISVLKPINSLTEREIEVYAFNHSKFINIPTMYDASHHQILLTDFSGFNEGLWTLFLKVNRELYPLCMKEDSVVTFDTFKYKCTLQNMNSFIQMKVDSHTLTPFMTRIESKEEKGLEFKVEFDVNQYSKYKLSIEDRKNDMNELMDLTLDGKILKTLIPIKALYVTQSSKRVFIIRDGEQPMKYRLGLNKKDFKKSIVLNNIYDSQRLRTRFYKRKDKSLGLTTSRPSLYKIVSSVKDFKINGYIGSLSNFPGCKAYLVLEERETMNSVRIEVKKYFKIDLLKFNLVKLKTKDKTIIDLFVVIENKDREIVRKEKIRYEKSVYKKDNYYDYKIIKDLQGDSHHFLITTTPFHNLKVESFKVSHNIRLPQTTVKRDSNVWLIGERSSTAQDNGIVFFNWLQKNTTIDAFYVIEEDSPDYFPIKDNPNVLIFGSPKHFEIAFKAKVLAGTHDLENLLPFKAARGFFDYEDTIKVFLQHGVLGRKNVEYHKKFYDEPFDLFIVSSEPEKEKVVMDAMGYDDKEVAVTGLARFDNLVQETKPRDILLMPTWRDWINTDQQFLGSDYYLTYSSLIRNKKLINLLEEYKINLNFYPHYRAQSFFQKDIEKLNERINFIPQGSDTVQNLLIQHALLITDYSSVSFDFTVMKKPVIFYHFDVGRFFRKGILRGVEETFLGRIGKEEDELVTLIEERIKSGFSDYDNDLSGILEYQDRNNCERIYNQIMSMVNPR